MRVTAAMVRSRILHNMSSSLDVLQLCQTQLATGKRILRPSDDAVGTAKALNMRTLLRDNNQFMENIDDASGWLTDSEAAIDQMASLMNEFKEIAVSGANDTKGEPERAALAEQVEDLIERLLDLVNTRYGDRYIFAGTHTLTRPYSAVCSVDAENFSFPDDEWLDLGNARIESGSVTVADGLGGTYTEGVDYEIDYAAGRIRRIPAGSMTTGTGYTISYTSENITGVNLDVPGTDGSVNREVAQGVYEAINLGGESLLNSGTDVFSLLMDVRDRLYRNDGASVSAELDNIDAALDQISRGLGGTGALQRSFELTRTRLETENANLQALISRLEDADIAEVTMKLQTKQMAYEAALASAATIMNTNLLSFIK
jgi:flagellin-like hook-associated protein FlgL